MQLLLHPLNQEITSGNGEVIIEPGFIVTALVVNITQISTQDLGNVIIKVQCSVDNNNWLDVPNLITGNLSATGVITITLSGGFPTGDYVRIFWTFNDADSITFESFCLGAK